MHRHDSATEVLTQAVVRYAVERMRLDPPPLDKTRPAAELRAMAGKTVTAKGIGGLEALRIFADVLGPASISIDHPRFLSFVPAAPTEAAILFDLVVGALSIYGGSWLEGGGAVFAENEALRYISDLVGFPETAGGVFVTGGTAGNLSALLAARFIGGIGPAANMTAAAGLMLTCNGAHSSVASAARAIDADIELVPGDAKGRMWGSALRALLDGLSSDDRDRVFAVVATAGTTNAGVIDDLAGIAEVCNELDIWLHVDGAYGGAGLAAPSVRDRYRGVELADSFIVDPHKWLFAPFDCCALVYRDPAVARAAHVQHAEYLDVLHSGGDHLDDFEWNPSDFAHHLSRRARGLPLWFSLATYGTEAYRDAIQQALDVTRQGARLIDVADHLELIMEPELSVLLFRRTGWAPADYQAWSDRLLDEGTAFVTPTSWNGEVVLRLCIINPLTSVDDLRIIIDSLA